MQATKINRTEDSLLNPSTGAKEGSPAHAGIDPLLVLRFDGGDSMASGKPALEDVEAAVIDFGGTGDGDGKRAGFVTPTSPKEAFV